jgi:resuscitation-promoting factor RpfA
MVDHLQLSPAELLNLVEAAEPNPLLRKVDALCELRAWDDLVALAAQCREATERGKQLWPIAEHVDYRLALEAPAAYAAQVLHPTAGRFAAGPLTEVAASTHTFDELHPYLTLPSTAGVVAAERVVRGEDLRERPEAHPEVMDLPMRLEPWEPPYALATYKSSSVEVPSPELPPLRREGRGRPGVVVEDDELGAVLLDVVGAWISGSNARAEVAISEGVEAAIGALGVGAGSFWIGQLTPEQAMALMAWAGAAGGAHGRRRGAAAGRSAAWWAAVALTDLDWPPDPDELGEALADLHWYRWEPKQLAGGWHLHLAVESPADGWAAAIAAEDLAERT